MRPLFMGYGSVTLTLFALSFTLSSPALGDVIYNNLTPNDAMGVAARPDGNGGFEIEAGDDFVLTTPVSLTSASFVGLEVSPTGATPTVQGVVVEIYRVFPNDSDVGRTSGPPTFSTPQVPTRVNSPSDVALDSRDSTGGDLSFVTSVLAGSFTTLNSVQPGGIHPAPGQKTGGNGPLTGQEVQFDVSFTAPFNLPPDHYFFVPQVLLSDGAQFYWLSASRPISGLGTTPLPAGFTDLQSWTRDAALDPDWLRVGTDIVGGSPAPTFNAAFSLEGNVVPEPATNVGIAICLALLYYLRRRIA